MVGAIKKLDKKFLMFTCCILLLPILLIVFLMIIQGCSNQKMSYEKYENKMISAAEKYFDENDLFPQSESAISRVDLSKLVEDEYIKDTLKSLDDDTCKGTVTVRRNGSTVEENKDGFLNYTVSLECKDYKTVTLNDLLIEDLTTSESGLYKYGSSYIYKGDDVDNYIKFYGTLYRILKIDENGILKLVKTESENINQQWDNKYNTEVNNAYGKNIYKDSIVLKKLMAYYKNDKRIKKLAKEKIVSQDVCIGARKIGDIGITSQSDCSKILEKQPISLINVSDYASASLDSECNSIRAKSCRNYNYLRSVDIGSWTVNAVADNTYEVYILTDGIISRQEANRYDSYSVVIYIDGNEIISSGNGTSSDPYVIE